MKMSNAVTCHPSVRIAGTETDYTPALCTDRKCSSVSGASHMHCPFCVKIEVYHDPRILKAHYRVKHVDKGIQFAGLKILRCCEQCDIVGAIKGEKKFKGAHWHCYRCKNGFNRRDEAIKHYKTHFRHPYTTFQIHISQEVNSSMEYQERKEGDTENRNPVTSIVLQNGEQSLSNENSQEEHSSDIPESGTVIDGMADIAQPTEGQTAIMIIHSDHVEGAVTDHNYKASNADVPEHKKEPPEISISELQTKILQLKEEKHILETSTNAEIERLKALISEQEKELENLRKRERELERKIMAPTDDKMKQLLESLRDQHAQLLQEQLMQVRKEVFISSTNENKNCTYTNQNSSKVGNHQVVGITLQQNPTFSPNVSASYTICMPKANPKEFTTSLLNIPRQDKFVKSAGDSSECTENVVIPTSACGNLVVAQSNFNQPNGNIAFVTEEQLQNCIGATATIFNQNSSPYFIVNQKGETQILGAKRKLYVAEYPTVKKLTKNDT